MSKLLTRLRALSVFRALLYDGPMEALCAYLTNQEGGNEREAVSSYGEFVSQLYEDSAGDMGLYIQNKVLSVENPYIRAIGRGETPPPFMTRCVEEELKTLQAVAALTPNDLLGRWDGQDFLPLFSSTPVDLTANYLRRIEEIGRYGYGIYAHHHMFYLENSDCIGNDGGGSKKGRSRIVPVLHPDTVQLSDLVGYQREKQLILSNTLALLAGQPAANMLLTGDAGTGKSSTIKAVVNKLYPDGLRIIEIRRDQLRELPAVLDELSENPLKFILFIDDLSFQKGDDKYSALKAVLEGSVSAKSSNVVIYATSNRRHLVKETFSDRDGDDIHRGETMQEMISLSERFGLHITFQKPDKAAYLGIVHHLAEAQGVACPDLDVQAEQFALGRGGRSPRAARQFVNSLTVKSGK